MAEDPEHEKRKEMFSKLKKDKQEKEAYENKISSLEKDLATIRTDHSQLKQSFNLLKQTNRDLERQLLKSTGMFNRIICRAKIKLRGCSG